MVLPCLTKPPASAARTSGGGGRNCKQSRHRAPRRVDEQIRVRTGTAHRRRRGGLAPATAEHFDPKVAMTVRSPSNRTPPRWLSIRLS